MPVKLEKARQGGKLLTHIKTCIKKPAKPKASGFV
jgi:hypothetical protein